MDKRGYEIIQGALASADLSGITRIKPWIGGDEKVEYVTITLDNSPLLRVRPVPAEVLNALGSAGLLDNEREFTEDTPRLQVMGLDALGITFRDLNWQ